MRNLKKIKGCLLGGAIGDALGYDIEFRKGIKTREHTRYFNKGIISDDTQMTLFTANALIWRETRASLRGIGMPYVDAIYFGYLDWLDTQMKRKSENKMTWIKELEELNQDRHPGMTCLSALSSGKKGTLDNPINDSKGCGGIMRIAPIGLYLNNPEEAGICCAEASAITHGHPLGIIPSYVMGVLINLLVNTELDLNEAINEAIKTYDKKFDIYDRKTKKYFMSLINKAIELSKQNIDDVIAIKQLGEGWVAEETLAIAIYSCLKYSNSFEDAIICAINHDGDSDSTGAVAGNIMGAYLGYSNIPKFYLDDLELKDVISEIAEDLSVAIPVSEYSSNDDKYWLSKYVYCSRDLTLK